jgi:5-(carboxyamino)imidazole ribonucleotide synthase
MDLKVKTIGIIGGGQLGMMLTQAAHQLGFDVAILEKGMDCPAYSVLDLGKDKFIQGELSDYSKLKELADCSDVLTFEIEHIDTDLLKQLELETNKTIHPSPKILEIINDKFTQKSFLKKSGLPIGKFEPIRSLKNFDKLIRQFGLPLVIKSRKGGYDGGGNFVIKSKSELDLLILKLDLIKTHEHYFVEKFIPFEREIAVLLARSIGGEISVYPTIDTSQENNVCTQTLVPSTLNLETQEKAKTIGIAIAQKFDYVGIMAVEMFVLGTGEILINEIAPRVHNSGHWTMDGSTTSQFEQHLRCITGMKLGSVENKSPTTLMRNIFGSNYEVLKNLQSDPQPNISFYDYNKKEARPNRKMGHVNITGDSKGEIEALLSKIQVKKSSLDS